jgi:hypothetical protein
VLDGTLSRVIMLASAGAAAGAGAAGPGAAGARAAGAARAAREWAGRAGSALGLLRVVLRVPDSGVVAMTLMSGSVVCACAAHGASNRIAPAVRMMSRDRRGRRPHPRLCCTVKSPIPDANISNIRPLSRGSFAKSDRELLASSGATTGRSPPASIDCRIPEVRIGILPRVAFARHKIW